MDEFVRGDCAPIIELRLECTACGLRISFPTTDETPICACRKCWEVLPAAGGGRYPSKNESRC